MTTEPCERSIRHVREHLADVINDAVQGRVTYVTSRGRRVAAIIPIAAISAAGFPDRDTGPPAATSDESPDPVPAATFAGEAG